MAKKKTLLIIPVVLLMTLIISIVTPMCVYADDNAYQPRLEAPSSSSPYYSRQLNYYFQTGSGMPNCVAYAYGRIYEMNGEAPLLTHGSAGSWWFMNKSGGYYDYGSEPRLGAIACWSGHVAVVEAIGKNGVTLSESHYRRVYFDTVTCNPASYLKRQHFYGYIYAYNGGITKEVEERLLNATNKNSDQYMTEKQQPINVDNQFTLTKLGVENGTSIDIVPTIPLLQDRLNS